MVGGARLKIFDKLESFAMISTKELDLVDFLRSGRKVKSLILSLNNRVLWLKWRVLSGFWLG